MKKFLLVLALICAMFSSAYAADSTKLGLITPTSGVLSFGGNEAKNALIMAVEEKGTLFGKPIELVVADAPDSTAAVAEMERLITQEKLKVVFSGYGSSLEEAWQKVAERHQVLNLGLVNWSDKLTEAGLKYYFRWAPPSSWLCQYLVEALEGLGKEYLQKNPADLKVMLVNADTTGYLSNAILDSLKSRNFTNVTHETYPSDLKDFTSLLLKVRGYNPDILVLCQYSADGMAFRRQMVAMDYEPPITMGAGLIYDQPEFSTLGPVAADGPLATSYTNPGMNPAVAPGLAEFKTEYEKRFGHLPLTHALQAYAGGLVYLDVIESVGSFDVEKIRAALVDYKLEPGKTAAYWGADFDAKTGQNMLAGKPCVVGQWVKGEYKVVWPPEFAVQPIQLPLKPFSQRAK